MNGFFGDFFDFNNDGKLDAFEQAAEFSAFMNIINNEDDSDDAENDEN